MSYQVIEKIVPIFMVIAIIGAVGMVGLYPVRKKYKYRKWRGPYMKNLGASIAFTGLVPCCIWVLGRQAKPATLLIIMVIGAIPGIIAYITLRRKHAAVLRYEETHPEEQFDIVVSEEAQERLRKRKEKGFLHWFFKGDRD